MSSSLSTAAPAECACDARFRPACGGPLFGRGGTQFCAIHYPGDEKREAFAAALREKLERADRDGLDLRGAWFPERFHFRGRLAGPAVFSDAVFNGGAEFSYDTTSQPRWEPGTVFEQAADFSNARFEGPADFTRCVFKRKAQFNRADFRGEAVFNEAAFEGSAGFSTAEFGGRSDFRGARFHNTANFSLGSFKGVADFSNATFEVVPGFEYAVAAFSGAAFGDEANFSNASFRAGVSFAEADFEKNLKLTLADFHGMADFSGAFFGDYVRVISAPGKPVFDKDASLDMQHARMKEPGRVLFDTPYLRPHWFADVDAREFTFSNVEWDWAEVTVAREVEALKALDDWKGRGRLSTHRAVSVACRHLALNAEENHRYDEASELRYMAMEAKRLQGGGGRFVPWKLGWWYKLASGYGEQAPKAAAVLLAVLLAFAVVYWKADCAGLPYFGGDRCMTWAVKPGDAATREPTGDFSASLAYSLGVMTLQRPEPRPSSPLAQITVGLETVLGPLQFALLALAVRRQFMH